MAYKLNKDIYQNVTDSVIASIENGAGEWHCPWARGAQAMPVNAVTGHKYRGINVIMLWIAAGENEWPNEWASYKQWQSKGAQVCKGEKGTTIAFYKSLQFDRKNDHGDVVMGDNGEPRVNTVMMARASTVFNAAQVEGYEPVAAPDQPMFERIGNAETFVSSTNAVIKHGGERAYYRPSEDLIQMPSPESFTGTDTSTAQEAYYGTILHELTHWTSQDKRCDRKLGSRFGSQAYAAEELIAELGAAFLCAGLNITNQPRADHAQYLSHWLDILKGAKRAIFTAAAKAAQAVDYLDSLQAATAIAA